MKTIRLAATAAALLLAASAASAQSSPAATPALAARRIAGAAPRIDGRLDDEAWSAAPAATGFVQRQPVPGRAASEQTEARVLFDGDAVYVALRLHDRRPDSIAAPLARRDAAPEHSEWAYVMLDSNDDNRSGFIFAVNPRGVQRDYLVYDDAREDGSWDAVWSAAARTDSAGWTAELRIPLSQLRFSPGRSTWGINFGRRLARRDELSFWAPWLPDAPGYVSRFGALTGLTGLRSPRRLELVPYAVARLERTPGDAADPFHRASEPGASVGMDLAYGLTSELRLAATINPDFGQVEGDPAKVNLTAFESRFDEKRPFFVQGTDVFGFSLQDGSRLFYSRRIGRAPQTALPDAPFGDSPLASTILGAVKLSGRTARGWSLGFLDAVTAEEGGRYVDREGAVHTAAVEPLTHYAVARVARDFAGGRSTLGAIVTSTNRRIGDERLGVLPTGAWVAGVDGRHRFGGGDYEVRGHLVGSRVGGSEIAIARLQRQSAHRFQRPDADHLRYDPQRTRLEGVDAALHVARIGGVWRWEARGAVRTPGFDVNDIGFQSSADRATQGFSVEYRRSRPGALFRRWDLEASQSSEWTLGGERLTLSTNLFGNFQFANYWGGFAQLLRRYPALSTSALRGGPALRGAGYWRPIVQINTDRRKAASGRMRVNAALGDEGDRSVELRPSIDLRPSPRMNLSAGVVAEWNRTPRQYVDQRRIGDASHYLFGSLERRELSLEGRLNYTFTPRLSLELYAEPFLSAGSFGGFAEVADPRASDPARRFRRFGDQEVRLDDATGRYRLDLDGDGTPDTDFANPDARVNLRDLRSNAVLRWEYRPGSALFLVWSQARDTRSAGRLDGVTDELSSLWHAPASHVLLLKLSHRLGR